MSELRDRLYRHVRIFTGERTPITPETEVYKDLRISGDDLWELLLNLNKDFTTDFSAMNLSQFALGECDYDWLPWPFDHRRKYKSLTIGALEEAVAGGRWKDGQE